MSLHATTVYDRESVRTKAQLARAAEQPRHEISKLALELLQQRHRAQHVVNVENKQRAIVLVEGKLSTAAAELAARHGQEVTGLEDDKFALFEEFDVRRVAWANATTADEPQLAEEASKHTALIEDVVSSKLREDEQAKKSLQSTIWNLEVGYGRGAEGTQMINQACEQAAKIQAERELIHAERLASLEASWKAHRLELETAIRLGKPQRRLARLELEDEYQNRLGELIQQQEAVQLRQKRELEALAEERICVHAGVLEGFDAADADLLDERKRVNEWWNSLLNEATARRGQIDEDEQQALDNIDFPDASKMAQTRKAAGAAETGMDAVAVEVTDTTDATAENSQHTSTTRTAAVAVGSSRPQHMTSEEAQAFESGATAGYEGAEADTLPPTTIQRNHTATTPPFGAGIDAQTTREEVARHSVASSVRTPDKPDALRIGAGFMTSTDSTTLVSEVKSDAGSPYIHVDAEVALVRERSGTPDSACSDFVEI